MPPGRKPIPAESLRAENVPSRPLPVVVGGRVAPVEPPDLSPAMKLCWDTIVKDLVEADVIDSADAGVIEAAAVFWGRAREARKAMKGRRLLITTPQGQVPNRLLDIERNSWQQFRGLAETLPLSPWGRARLGLKSKEAGRGSEAEIGLPPRLRAVSE